MSSILMDKIIDFIQSTEYDDIPDDVVQMSKLAILDTVGVAIAGWNESSVTTLKNVYIDRKSEYENASLWGEQGKVPLEFAGLINGTAAHALDFDDVTPTALAHPSAPIVSAILPLGEYLGKSGSDVVTAYVIGTEVMIRLGQVMGVHHYDLGWHATSTLGTIGAAVACGYLMNLDRDRLENSIAISASMSGGLQKNFGTMTKPLHVGLAAQNAIQSVLLASKGFTGNNMIFETRGYFNAFGGNKEWVQYKEIIKRMEFGNPYDFQENGLSVKKFPCCYATHRFIQGILELREENNLNLEDISEIEILVPPGGLLPLIHKRPITGLQGKFSAEYTSIAALIDGEINLNTFTDQSVLREEVQRLLPIVKINESVGKPVEGHVLDKTPVTVVLKMENGDVYNKSKLHAPGSKGDPMKIEDYESKWMHCILYAYSSSYKDNSQIEKEIKNIFHEFVQVESISHVGNWISKINSLII